MKEECKKCICNECVSQSSCEKSCKLCETLLGGVTYCKNESRCEQLELFSEAGDMDKWTVLCVAIILIMSFVALMRNRDE